MKRNVNVEVTAKRGESFESLYKRFLRKFKQSGVIQDCKNKEYYVKPSIKRNNKKRKAQRKNFKENLDGNRN